MLGENQEKRLYIFISIRLPILAFLSLITDTVKDFCYRQNRYIGLYRYISAYQSTAAWMNI